MTENKVFNNAKWIILCRVIQALLQIVLNMLTARYFGPSNYGLINYAGSVVAFALPLMQLGLQSTLVQELVETPEQEGKILGTSLVMSLLSSGVCIIMVGSFVATTNRGEAETLIVCLLYSLSLIFRALELMQYWFQYKLKAKFSSIVMLCAYVVVSIYRVYLLLTSKSIFWFAVVNSVDYGIIGFALLIVYHKLGSQRLSFSFQMCKRLLSRSKFYILASMMVTLFQNTDHIMLKMISGDAENGFYSAAVASIGACQFIYAAIIDSFRPMILSCKKAGSDNYEKNISTLYCIIIFLSLFQSVGFTLFANLIIKVLYGIEFLAAAPVLQVLVWYVAFSYMGAVRNVWILAEGKQSFLWKINLAGALMNVVMNLILIPYFGALGAAFASMVTQVFTNFLLGFIIKPLRTNQRLLLKGLNPVLLVDMVKKRNN